MTKIDHCSFCGVSRGERRFMMNGPTVAICGDCVVVAVSMMATHMGLTIDSAAVLEVSVFAAGDRAKGVITSVPANLPGGEFVVLKAKDEP